MKKLLFSITALTISTCISATNPCSSNYQTDASRFVAHGTGHARHFDTARVKAQMDANSKLKDGILVWIKQLTDQYIVDSNLDSSAYRDIFDQICQKKIEAQVNSASVICTKKGNEIDDLLSAYVSLAIDRKAVIESFKKAFANDNRLDGVYNEDKFLALCKADTEKLKKKKK